MTPRKGGIGRRPGKSKSNKNKHVSETSATKKSYAIVKKKKEEGIKKAEQAIKMKERGERRIMQTSAPICVDADEIEALKKNQSIGRQIGWVTKELEKTQNFFNCG